MSHQVEVSRVVAASPEQVYGIVSDLPRMGEFSPENTGGRWVKGATGPALGARFEGTNRIGKRKWKTVATVVTCEPGREFAFDVTAAGCKVARWGFLLEASEGGTKVTEYWDDHRNPLMAKITGFALSVPDRATRNSANMEQTLERISAGL